MKEIILSLVLTGLTSLGFTQNMGITFTRQKNWSEVKALAKTQNKYIFVDVLATWCGSCKAMDETVYPSKVVGDFMNSRFVSVKVQGDRTLTDSETTKTWYEDAANIIEEYHVDAYPTLLFFSPDGNLIHRGGATDEKGLLKLAQESVDKLKQYENTFKAYKAGALTVSEVRDLALTARSLEKKKDAQELADDYANSALFKLSDTDLYARENLLFMAKFMGGPEHKIYRFFLANKEKINKVLGFYQAEMKVMDFISDNYLPKSNTWKKSHPDWTTLVKKVTQKFGVLGLERCLEQKMAFDMMTEDWKSFGTSYMKFFGAYLKTTRWDPNNFSWAVFEHVREAKVLEFAVGIMKYTLEKWNSNDAASYDTYANLLYKTGNRKRAIEWEENAVKLSKDKSLIETLAKMRKGIKTW